MTRIGFSALAARAALGDRIEGGTLAARRRWEVHPSWGTCGTIGSRQRVTPHSTPRQLATTRLRLPKKPPTHQPPRFTSGTSRKTNWVADRERGTSTARGYGANWRKLRELVMNRDVGLCQPCLKQGRTTVAKEVDHVLPKAAGGTDALDNLQAICRNCHKLKTARESRQTMELKGRGSQKAPAYPSKTAFCLTFCAAPK